MYISFAAAVLCSILYCVHPLRVLWDFQGPTITMALPLPPPPGRGGRAPFPPPPHCFAAAVWYSYGLWGGGGGRGGERDIANSFCPTSPTSLPHLDIVKSLRPGRGGKQEGWRALPPLLPLPRPLYGKI
jgi:hypothetical protein